MKKILKEFFISTLLFFGIFHVTLQVDWLNLFHLSPTIVGDKLSEWVWDLTYKGLNEVKNDNVRLPIDTLVHEMCTANGIDTTSISVVISRNPDVNAFATVGRHIIVNTGLIEKMDNEAQLCAVIGHEMAHLELGHIQSGIRQQAIFQVILILLTGNGNIDSLINITSQMISNSITRAKENEADKQGARFLYAMHLNPMEMANTLESFESYGILSYISDHADSKKRAENIRKMHFPHKGPYRQILSQETWEKLKNSL
ncbi:MAG: M48 family metallopeptidase [Bacteroidaceae bacterium]|nr:M48 family metallopeptidase [Bacteroidaceae bacterium]